MTAFDPAEHMFGGFTSTDGTIEFYGRVNSLLTDTSVVLDIGAGRGAWFHEDRCAFRRELRSIKGKVAEYIGADIDPVVMGNSVTDRNVMITDGRVGVPDQSLDMIICDYVLEHIVDVTGFAREVTRILRPGGYFCARTPHKWNYVSCAARVIQNARHADWLSRIQPERKRVDVFPTAYRCNTLGIVRTHFPGSEWDSGSYLYTSEPRYYFGSRSAFGLFSLVHKFAPLAFTGNLFLFLRRKVRGNSRSGTDEPSNHQSPQRVS